MSGMGEIFRFQFHEGPIKTHRTASSECERIEFQFHEGPIKTNHSIDSSLFSSCFNSMKVRLKPYSFLMWSGSLSVSIP